MPGKKISSEQPNEPGMATGPARFNLHAETDLGSVHLIVADLQRSVEFYRRSIGLELDKVVGNQAYLTAGGRDLLVLNEIPGATKIPRRSGLYHFAILTPSRQALGDSLRRLIDTGSEIQGGADHLVSEAIYLADPDGNGIEIYRDRPRDEWRYDNGQLKMATDPLDFKGILDTAREINGSIAAGSSLGHMHLHVADLDQAVNFYTQIIGFDFIMGYMGSAAFLSAGGYHHHIGLNTWNGIGAPPNPVQAVGLKYFTINLQGEGERAAVIERFDRSGWKYDEQGAGILVRDPSGNGILLEIAG